MNDWLKQSAADLGRGIAAGKIDPVALTEAQLNAIEGHPLKDRIYARTTPDRALAEAKAASERARLGLLRSPLDGVPVSWKDLFDTAGVATESGSALLKDRIPATDAKVLTTATALGSVCLGKTHMSELAFSGLGYNPITNTPPCVNDPDALPGGSSSGAAASVAFGLAPLAIGSDTGGSVRVPSAWNDLVGLKTAHGRVSLEGTVPLCASFDTVGPLARTVEDAALGLALLEGGKPADLRGATLKGRKMAILQTSVFDGIDDAPRAAFESAVERMKAAGLAVEPLEVPELEEAMMLSPVVFPGEAYGTWREEIEAAPEKMFSEILKRFRQGASVTAPDFVAAWLKLDEVRAIWAKVTARFDAVLCPTAAILPPNLDRLLSDEEYYVKTNLMALRNTRVGNLMGQAALTLPTGVPSCGISLMAGPASEERLLRLGAAAEAALA
ncbi:amidase [Chachezhania sediminis]|uniref:amidase n=1 Tax=Chachezhania sediminis TaxID=2599291 RepID=UPI00131B96B6|nr:amidase family protein [Chachezhania sediminis]